MQYERKKFLAKTKLVYPDTFHKSFRNSFALRLGAYFNCKTIPKVALIRFCYSKKETLIVS